MRTFPSPLMSCFMINWSICASVILKLSFLHPSFISALVSFPSPFLSNSFEYGEIKQFRVGNNKHEIFLFTLSVYRIHTRLNLIHTRLSKLGNNFAGNAITCFMSCCVLVHVVYFVLLGYCAAARIV